MAGYLIIVDGLRGFGIEIRWPSGFRSLRGFPTKEEAQAWIDSDRRCDAARLDPDPDLDSATA
jgi:hypothetical protein